MFSTPIDMETIQEVKDFLMSDDCDFVSNMNKAGLSFGAMALVLQAIEEKIDEVESILVKED